MSDRRVPSYGAVKVHGAKLQHIISKLESLRPLDDDGACFMAEAETLLSFAQSWINGIDPSDGEADQQAVEDSIDKLYRLVFNPGGYVERRARPLRLVAVGGYSPTGYSPTGEPSGGVPPSAS